MTRMGQLFCAGLLAALAGTQPAAARMCAPYSVAATGQPAYFEFLGANQARSAWARKVARSALGTPYSRWRLSDGGKTTCRRIADRYRCVAVASPCRDGAASAAPQTRRGPA